MILECLLVSRDQEVVRVLRPALEKLSINLEVCSGARSGREILSSEKFDAVVVDCDDLQGGMEVLKDLRKQPSNKNSVTFAILNGKTTTRQTFEIGTNFVLQKPIQPVNALRCFSAALGLMTRERRRYYRHPVDMPTTIIFADGPDLKVTATNLSEGGMAVQFHGKLPKAPIAKVQFTLPGTRTSMEPRADIAWADGSGHAGIRFVEVPQTSREQMDRWLTAQIDGLQAGLKS
jgi:CheY-like chemotaxis protein